jgi:formate/nitrite transporter FocA (FNT family)
MDFFKQEITIKKKAWEILLEGILSSIIISIIMYYCFSNEGIAKIINESTLTPLMLIKIVFPVILIIYIMISLTIIVLYQDKQKTKKKKKKK